MTLNRVGCGSLRSHLSSIALISCFHLHVLDSWLLYSFFFYWNASQVFVQCDCIAALIHLRRRPLAVLLLLFKPGFIIIVVCVSISSHASLHLSFSQSNISGLLNVYLSWLAWNIPTSCMARYLRQFLWLLGAPAVDMNALSVDLAVQKRFFFRPWDILMSCVQFRTCCRLRGLACHQVKRCSAPDILTFFKGSFASQGWHSMLRYRLVKLMPFKERIFLWLSILSVACNSLFVHKLLGWLLEYLRCIVVRLHALEPLEKFVVFFCYLIKSVYAGAVVQRRHYLKGWIVELTIFGWWLQIPLCSRLKCASACVTSVERRARCAQGRLITELYCLRELCHALNKVPLLITTIANLSVLILSNEWVRSFVLVGAIR